MPETWLNIPMCIVKAFQDDVAHQSHIVEMVSLISGKVTSQKEKIFNLKDYLEKLVQKEKQALKNELVSNIKQTEQRLQSNSKEFEETVNQNTREITEIKDTLHKIRFDMRAIEESMETKEKCSEKLQALEKSLKTNSE